jgi:putative ubiquitin-RnfH superfamily antitoxin RatB of RatAB toxin-antitoxin module
MPEQACIHVSVVYAEAAQVFEVALRLPVGATVGEAIEASRVREARPDVDINADRIGIFSRKATFDTPLRDGDRVEIYRPLKVDPKEARRRRTEEAVRKQRAVKAKQPQVGLIPDSVRGSPTSRDS